MLRMRLRRTGARKQPRYRVVIAEARAPRDGAFVDSIGFYDPLTEPATVRIDGEKARNWLAKGVQPSDTVVRLLKGAGLGEGLPDRPHRAAPAAVEEPVAAEAAPQPATAGRRSRAAAPAAAEAAAESAPAAEVTAEAAEPVEAAAAEPPEPEE